MAAALDYDVSGHLALPGKEPEASGRGSGCEKKR